MNKDEVLKLAKLARLDISDAEAEDLSHEFDAILSYVSEVKKVTATGLSPRPTETLGGEVNILRADEHPHEPGIYTDTLLAAAPSREGQYVKVPNIL